jgi:hypothetical protein
MTDLFYTDSEAGYWKSLQGFWIGLLKATSSILKRVMEALFSGHKRVDNYFTGKSLSRFRYSEAAYGKIIIFSQSFHSSKKIFWILTVKQQDRNKMKNAQRTFRKY